MTSTEIRSKQKEVLDAINSAREAESLPPLEVDDTLTRTAEDLAQNAALQGAISTQENRLPTLIAAGTFARFALSHQAMEDNAEQIVQALTNSPKAKANILHVRVTHVGIGIVEKNGRLFGALDLARIVPTADRESSRKNLEERVQLARKRNSVKPVEFEPKLSEQADLITAEFIKGGKTSEELVEKAQKTLGGETFSIGRVTITFQVAGTVDAMVIPSITSDPKVVYAGLGFAQGNHPDHEPGSFAMALLLAESQTAHEIERYESKLPPPKSAPSRSSSRGSLVDRAWVATLTGNHKKAAANFLEAYRKKKEPKLLYEAARAHARNGDMDAALSTMKQYADLVEGEEKTKALEKVSLLEKGETIFSTSEKKKMSVEAERFFAMGRRLFEQKEWEGAIDAFQQAYAYTKHPDIIYNIGLVHRRAGRIGEALHFFSEYQKAVPKAGNVEEAKQLFEIGVELFRAGQFETSSRNFAMSYSYLPFPDLIYNLALCHKAMGQNETAVRFLREYIDTDPSKKERLEAEKIIKELTPNQPPSQ